MFVKSLSSLQFLTYSAFFAVVVAALFKFVPGRRPPVRTGPYPDETLYAHDRKVAKYFVAGSFFDTVPAGDTYVLGAILHDWDDERATQILRTIRVAAPQNARVVIRDAVIPPGNDPHGNKWLDLLMLVLLRGRERTEEEWRLLLAQSDFDVVSISDGMIEARCR